MAKVLKGAGCGLEQVVQTRKDCRGRTTQFANSDFMILSTMILPNRLSAIRGGPRQNLEIVTASSSWPASSCPVSFCQLLGELRNADRKIRDRKIEPARPIGRAATTINRQRGEPQKSLWQNHGGQNHQDRSRSNSFPNWNGVQSIQDLPAQLRRVRRAPRGVERAGLVLPLRFGSA